MQILETELFEGLDYAFFISGSLMSSILRGTW